MHAIVDGFVDIANLMAPCTMYLLIQICDLPEKQMLRAPNP